MIDFKYFAKDEIIKMGESTSEYPSNIMVGNCYLLRYSKTDPTTSRIDFAKELDCRGSKLDFAEKGLENNFVSAGFFVFNPEIFELLDNDSILENEPLRLLVKNSELMAFKHEAFWKPMDTLRDMEEINEIWANGFAPWKNWSDDK
jgi:NDP-sugar pyrophosphorylase family protein